LEWKGRHKMPPVKIFWDPAGLELDYLSSKRYLRATDGDTPFVSVSIRLLSIDTPETHYPGNAKPSGQDQNLAQLADWLRQGKAPIEADLAAHLHSKLATGTAGTLHETQGKKAQDVFKDLIEQKLTRPGSTRKRSVFLWAAETHFDQFGRLLAYMAPKYSANELASLTLKERATFNLLLVEAGWAAPLPIYPSIPKHADLELLQQAAKEAFDSGKGAWADSEMLTGYEFRMCVKLFKVTQKLVSGRKLASAEKSGWISRYCVDMTTREIFYPQDYFRVGPYNRIFIWPQDVTEAVGRLNLLPAG
jgi:endonuclease YncB( thermonuclease family)